MHTQMLDFWSPLNFLTIELINDDSNRKIHFTYFPLWIHLDSES